MGSFTDQEIDQNARGLVTAVGNQPTEPPPSKDTSKPSIAGEVQELDYDVFTSCVELIELKEETKQTETSGLKAYFGSGVTLVIDQYTLRHKTGYIKIEDGKVGYVYPIRACQVCIRTARGEKDQQVQWEEGFRYSLYGSLIFKPADKPIEYIMFTFRKKE